MFTDLQIRASCDAIKIPLKQQLPRIYQDSQLYNSNSTKCQKMTLERKLVKSTAGDKSAVLKISKNLYLKQQLQINVVAALLIFHVVKKEKINDNITAVGKSAVLNTNLSVQLKQEPNAPVK